MDHTNHERAHTMAHNEITINRHRRDASTLTSNPPSDASHLTSAFSSSSSPVSSLGALDSVFTSIHSSTSSSSHTRSCLSQNLKVHLGVIKKLTTVTPAEQIALLGKDPDLLANIMSEIDALLKYITTCHNRMEMIRRSKHELEQKLIELKSKRNIDLLDLFRNSISFTQSNMADMIMSSSLDPSILASLRSVDPNSSRWKETSLELDRLRSTIRTYQEAEYNQARQISELKIKYENSEQRRESEKKAAEDEKRKMQAQFRRESEDHQRDEHKHAEARVQAEKKHTNLIKEIDDLKRVIRHKDDEWRRVYDQVQTEANTSQRANAELKGELLISRDQLAVTSQELEKNSAIVEEQRKKIEELELNTKSLNTSLLSSVFPPLTLPSFNEPMLRELTFNFLHKIEKQAEEQLFAELDSENEQEEEQTIAKMSEKEMPPPAGTEQKESAATEEPSKPQQESKTQP